MDAVAAFKQKEINAAYRRDIFELCFYYPQYTPQQAEDLPAGDVNGLLAIARLKEAERTFDMLNAMAAAQDSKAFEAYRDKLSAHMKLLEAML